MWVISKWISFITAVPFGTTVLGDILNEILVSSWYIWRVFCCILGTCGTLLCFSWQVSSLLDKLHSTRQNIHQIWQVRKMKLDQCFQLRLFEQDAEKASFIWMCECEQWACLILKHQGPVLWEKFNIPGIFFPFSVHLTWQKDQAKQLREDCWVICKFHIKSKNYMV